jgi:hypothetical protein
VESITEVKKKTVNGVYNQFSWARKTKEFVDMVEKLKFNKFIGQMKYGIGNRIENAIVT